MKEKVCLTFRKDASSKDFFYIMKAKLILKKYQHKFCNIHPNKKDKKMSLQLDKTASFSKNCIIKYSRLHALVRRKLKDIPFCKASDSN